MHEVKTSGNINDGGLFEDLLTTKSKNINAQLKDYPTIKEN